VRMRSRKPCTLWRRRLFGWYVRLLTASLRWVQGRSRRHSGPVRPMARTGAARSGRCCGFNRHRPPTLPDSPAGGPTAWTCGTRRYRVTEKRYARLIRQVKSPTSARGTGPARAAPSGRRMWKSGSHLTPRGPGPQRFRNLWIAPCSSAPPGVMFGPRRVSPRSSRPFPAAVPSPGATSPEMASDLG
jgi:hypothetical protein